MQREEAAAPALTAKPTRRSLALRLADLALPALIVLIALVAGAIEPRFFSIGNLTSLAKQIVPLAIASVGQAFAIISGGLDLSLAAVMSLAGVIGVLQMEPHGVLVGVAIMALTGIVAGTASGAIIAYFNTTPLIVTLGMMSISQAIALILANGVPIYSIPESFSDAVGFGQIYGVPVTVLIGAATMLVGSFLLRKTVFGRYVYAIGSNRSAAEKSGIDVRFHTMLVYAVAGLTSGIGAIALTAWIGAAQPVAVPTLTLQSLAAVVLGGVALTGGSGGMLQVLYGVIILGMLSNAMNMIGISDFYQTLAVGIVIILAVILDRFRRRAQR
jgi:ribose transport system permease protein